MVCTTFKCKLMQMNGTRERARLQLICINPIVPWQKCQKIESLLYKLSDIQKGTEWIARDNMIVSILFNSVAFETFRVRQKKHTTFLKWNIMCHQTISLEYVKPKSHEYTKRISFQKYCVDNIGKTCPFNSVFGVWMQQNFHHDSIIAGTPNLIRRNFHHSRFVRILYLHYISYYYGMNWILVNIPFAAECKWWK